eukprot:TRINITY_DN14586_c0_g3_i2.p2 TRINITY_DN14586_c0_g3~~TRINITY_DN14586_c0_g3_i2.p2  ORF type:complete len:367 (+),score=87.51 TRINITY_DN14586_c0_g3_i2:99-1103(+)
MPQYWWRASSFRSCCLRPCGQVEDPAQQPEVPASVRKTCTEANAAVRRAAASADMQKKIAGCQADESVPRTVIEGSEQIRREWLAHYAAAHRPAASTASAQDCAAPTALGAASSGEQQAQAKPGAGSSEDRQAPNGHADGRNERSDDVHSSALDLVPAETAGSRRPTYARDWLLLDVICHWVSTFVYRDWACVCSTAARAVAQVIFPVHRVWGTTAKLLGEFQSIGQAGFHDNHHFGPEPGPLLAAHHAVLALHKEALQTRNRDGRWKEFFLIHMQMTANLYEEMRLHQRQMFITSANRATNLLNAFRTLERTLEKRDARLAAATAVSSGSADP